MSSALEQFLQAVAADPDLQSQCGTVQSLLQLEQLAQSAGFAVPAYEFQLWAHHKAFNALWWLWADGGTSKKLEFFRGPLR